MIFVPIPSHRVNDFEITVWLVEYYGHIGRRNVYYGDGATYIETGAYILDEKDAIIFKLKFGL